MSRFVIVSFDGGGNQPPAFAVATALRERGHHVVVAGYARQRRRVECLDLPFVALPRSGSIDFQSAPAGERMRVLQASVMANPDHVADLAEVVEAAAADVVVVDAVMYAALSAAEYWAVPVAALAHTSPAAHETPAAAAARRPVLEQVAALRRRLGLPAAATTTALLDRFPVLVATLRSLDPVQRGPAWHHVGPLAPAGPHRQAAVLPWSTDASEPLVLVSLSTLTAYGDQTPALQAILDALAATGLRVLVTTGPAVSAVKLRAPRNAAVFSFLPHAHVMPAVSACVTHAGHGTVTAALANGVPLVCRPNPAADQPYLARRIAELGAGLSVPTDAGPDHVRWAVERVLSEPSFRAEAHRLAAEAAAAPGVAGAAEILERLAGVGRSAGPGPYTAGAPEREP